MKVVVELSGGADSALAAIMARNRYGVGTDLTGFFVNYGQEYAKEELAAAGALQHKLHLSSVVDINVEYCFGGPVVRQLYRDAGIAKEFFPMRNLVLTSLAVAYAARIGAQRVVTGSKSLVPVTEDPYSFRDSSVPFYTLLQGAVSYAQQSGPLILIEPLLALDRDRKMTKLEVYRSLRRYGIGLDETFSCYHPTTAGKECGECRNCREKEECREALDVDANDEEVERL